MPKIGDKFIIEIAEVVKWRESHGCEQEDYLVFPFGERLVNGIELKQLTPYNPDTDDAYQRGLNDAWEATRKVCGYITDRGMSNEELRKAFGTEVLGEIVVLPIGKVMSILTKHEAKKKAEEIEVGDEVETDYIGNGIITRKTKDDGWYIVIDKDFYRQAIHKSHIVRKTGRHFPQIAELLAEMRGDNDD